MQYTQCIREEWARSWGWGNNQDAAPTGLAPKHQRELTPERYTANIFIITFAIKVVIVYDIANMNNHLLNNSCTYNSFYCCL